MISVDLNSDLGESFGHFKIGNDEELLRCISSANIACGFHAGDHNVMMRTVELAKKFDVAIGAHPGLNDLAGFGRRELKVSPEEVYNMVVYQIGALQAVAASKGMKLNHVKPHGALYNMAEKDKALAEAIAQAVKDVDESLILYGLSGGVLCRAGEKIGLTVAHEVFADRTYQPDGTLTSRSEKNAIIHDPEEAVERVLRMVKEGKVAAINGQDIPIQADTICIHGDGPKALAFAEALKSRLEEENIRIVNPGAKNDERNIVS
jgi:5-oxoprolinase (ATP-hydrolysing) subunit A